jgi:hypothetical protein
MEPNDAVIRRDELIRQAYQVAGQRLAGSTSPDPELIATGELLFWIVAADDSVLRSARPGYAVYRNDEDDNRRAPDAGTEEPTERSRARSRGLGVGDFRYVRG